MNFSSTTLATVARPDPRRRLANAGFRDAASSAAFWDRIDSTQVSLCAPTELQYLRRLPAFQNAERVLDLGCGSGAFTEMLAHEFPDKTFHAIDASGPLLDIAAHRSGAENVLYHKADLYEICAEEWPRYDFILARFFVQYLPTLSGFLERAATLLDSNGTLLVVDACDRRISMTPSVRPMAPIHTGLSVAQRQGGIGRSAIELMRRRSSRFGLVAADDGVVLIHRALTWQRKKLLQRYFDCCLDIAAHYDPGDDAVAACRVSLDRWVHDPTSWGEFASRAIAFHTVSG